MSHAPLCFGFANLAPIAMTSSKEEQTNKISYRCNATKAPSQKSSHPYYFVSPVRPSEAQGTKDKALAVAR